MTVGMIGVGKILYGLIQNGIRRHQPYHGPVLGQRHVIKNRFHRTACHKGFTPASGDFHTHMGHSWNPVPVRRHASFAYLDVLGLPEGNPAFFDVVLNIHRIHKQGQILEHVFLVIF